MPRIRSAILLLLVPISIASATGPNAFRPHTVSWMETLFVPAYDAGPDGPDVPRAVVLRYQRWTSASGSVENMDEQACGVVFTHEVSLELSLVGGRVLDVSSRMGSEARMLGPFDGAIDYAGASGIGLWSAEGATTVLVLDDPGTSPGSRVEGPRCRSASSRQERRASRVRHPSTRMPRCGQECA